MKTIEVLKYAKEYVHERHADEVTQSHSEEVYEEDYHDMYENKEISF